jgi:hypothetical protein
MLSCKLYLFVITDILNKREGVFSIQENVNEIERLSFNFYNYFNGHEALLSSHEINEVKAKVEQIRFYHLPHEEFYKNISGNIYEICNGFVNFQTILIDSNEFDIPKFIEDRIKCKNLTSTNFKFSNN